MAGQKACLLAVVEMIKIASRGSDPVKGSSTVDHMVCSLVLLATLGLIIIMFIFRHIIWSKTGNTDNNEHDNYY